MTNWQGALLVIFGLAIAVAAWMARIEVVLMQNPTTIVVVDRWLATVQTCTLQGCGRIYPPK